VNQLTKEAMEFDIGIPIPKSHLHIKKNKDTYGLKGFPDNASKFFKAKTLAHLKSLQGCLLTDAKRLNENAKFATRSVVENGESGIRIWRIS
jgi:hypothetical protein